MLLSRLPRNIKASCHTLRHRLPSKTNSAAHQRLVSSTRWSVAAKYMALRAHSTPWSQLLAQNRDFCLPHLHLTPPLRGFPSEYCYPVRYGKTRMTWLPDGEKFWRYVYSFWQNVRTWQTHRQTPHDGIGRACIASHCKNVPLVRSLTNVVRLFKFFHCWTQQ